MPVNQLFYPWDTPQHFLLKWKIWLTSGLGLSPTSSCSQQSGSDCPEHDAKAVVCSNVEKENGAQKVGGLGTEGGVLHAAL